MSVAKRAAEPTTGTTTAHRLAGHRRVQDARTNDVEGPMTGSRPSAGRGTKAAGPAARGAFACAPPRAARAAPTSASATAARGMTVQGVYDLQPDGSVHVTETITWRFPAGEERHGIFRNIVVRMGYQDEEGKYRYYELTDVEVTSPSGAPADFRSATTVLHGDPDRQRGASGPSGTQVYEVRYTLHDVLNPIAGTGGEADTVELHYNVFGTNELTERTAVQRRGRAARLRRRRSPASRARPAATPSARRGPAVRRPSRHGPRAR